MLKCLSCSACVFKTYLWGIPNPKVLKAIKFRLFPSNQQCITYYNMFRNVSVHVNSVSCVQIAAAKEIASKIDMEQSALMYYLKDHSDLLSVSPSQWEACFRELKSNGFTIEDSLHMVTQHPPLLQLRVKDLAVSLKHWRGVHLGEKYVLSLLKTCPQLLLVPGQEISLRVAHLKPLGTNKGVVDLLKGAPSLMVESWNEVMAKLSFLVDEMKIEKRHILKSYALNRSLIFLKTRFVFLQRCGKYVKPKRAPDVNIPSKNPPLKSIVETNDEKFATVVAGVSLEEYEVFVDLYALEVENSELNDSDSE